MAIKELIGLAKQSWTVVSNPGVNAQATASKAAVAGIRHICTGITASLSAGSTAPAAVEVSINLRDGATGAGSVVWTGVMSLPATAGASAAPVQLSGLQIIGSVNTAMTLEFSAAGGANTFEAVSLQGFDMYEG
jgi:hypothetical protein